MILGYVFRRIPHGCSHVQELIDSVLIGAAFDQTVRLFFLDDGVWALKAQQQPDQFGLKHVAPMFDAMSLFGVEEVYVDQAALRQRNLNGADLVLPTTVLSDAVIQEKLHSCDHILTA